MASHVPPRQTCIDFRQVFRLTPRIFAFPVETSGMNEDVSTGCHGGGSAPESHGIPYQVMDT